MPYNRSRQDNWWKRRTKLERQLSCIALGMIFLALVLSISLIYYSQYGVPKGICLSSGCVNAAAEILDRLDEEIDPCDDFYSFACGGFIRKNTIPDDSSAYSTFTQVSDTLRNQLRSILEEPINPNDIHVIHVVKTYYKACMNEEFINQEGLTEAQTLFNTLGGWPVLEEAWDPNLFDWIEELKLLKENGLNFNYLLQITAGKDFGDSSRRIINIDQLAAFGLSSHKLRKGIHDPDVKGYLELMVDFAVMFGANDFKATEELQDVVNFEIMLAKQTVSKMENRNTSFYYNKMTIRQLKQQYGNIDWIKLLRYTFPEDVKLYDDKETLVEVPSYIDALDRILKTTSPKTLANYLIWRALLEIWPFLPQQFEDRIVKYQKTISGISEIPPRWKKCLSLTQDHVPVMLGATYVRKFFNDDIKSYAAELVKYIVGAFQKTIENDAAWMDDMTKSHALEKAKALTAHVAFPDELLDDQILEDMYSGIYVNEKLFLQSYLNVNKHEWNRLLHRLVEEVRKNDWREVTVPIVVNAFYYRLHNSMIIPAAILQGSFFNRERPSYLNYGAIGAIIGHEIVHAFDDQGSQFDKDGNLRNWWNEETQKAFVEKTRCFIERFNNIKVEQIGLNVSGVRTLGENIADNGGTKQAYLAYNSWADNFGEEKKLPGLKYTPRQLFWIAGAHNWCSKARDEFLKIKVQTDSHTPDRYRVNGMYQNLEFFAKDFKCSLGRKMNPQKKCSIW